MVERYCFKCRHRRQSPCGPVCRAYSDDITEQVKANQDQQDHVRLLRRIQGHETP